MIKKKADKKENIAEVSEETNAEKCFVLDKETLTVEMAAKLAIDLTKAEAKNIEESRISYGGYTLAITRDKKE